MVKCAMTPLHYKYALSLTIVSVKLYLESTFAAGTIYKQYKREFAETFKQIEKVTAQLILEAEQSPHNKLSTFQRNLNTFDSRVTVKCDDINSIELAVLRKRYSKKNSFVSIRKFFHLED